MVIDLRARWRNNDSSSLVVSDDRVKECRKEGGPFSAVLDVHAPWCRAFYYVLKAYCGYGNIKYTNRNGLNTNRKLANLEPVHGHRTR